MANVFRRKSLSNHELTSGSPVKIVVLGKNGVGKSALTVRLVTRRFIGEYDPDLECTCQYLSTCNGGSSRNAEIMDTSNRTSHSRVEKCVHWADCIILLYAVNDWASFAAIIAIKNILDGFRDSQLKPLFIVANKKDITSGREVPEAVGSKFASKSGCPFYEISVRESYQEVEKVFYDAIDLCRKCIYLLRCRRKITEVSCVGRLFDRKEVDSRPHPSQTIAMLPWLLLITSSLLQTLEAGSQLHGLRLAFHGDSSEIGEQRYRRSIPLPNIGSLITGKTKEGTSYQLAGCQMDMSSVDCKFTFVPNEQECKDKISLAKLIKHFFNGKDLEKITGKFLNPGVFEIDRFEIDTCQGDVNIDVSAKESFDVVKDKLSVLKGKMKANVNYKNELSFNNFGVEITGGIKVGGKEFPLTVTKKRDSPEFQFKVLVSQISAADVISAFSKKELEKSKKSPSEIGMFTKAVIHDPTFYGTRDRKENIEFALKGEVSGIEGLGSFRMFTLIQKQAEEPASVSIIADLKKIQPTAIISALTGKDLSSIPLINAVELDVALEFASQDITLVKDPDINILLQKFLAGDKTICKGTKIKVDFPIQEILKKVNSTASLEHVPKTLMIQVFITDEDIDLKFPQNVEMQLLNILMVLIPKVPELIFEKVFKTAPKIVIKKFNVNINTKAIDIQAVAPEEIVLAKDLISVKNAEFHLSHKPDGPWNFRLKAKKKMAGGVLDILIEKRGDEFTFHGSMDTLTTRQLAEHFGGKDMANSSMEKLKFLNFGINDLKVDAEFGKENSKIRISGNPVLFDWNGTQIEGFIVSKGSEKRMALGIFMTGIRIDEIISKIFNKQVLKSSWMSSMKSVLTVSNVGADSKEYDLQFTRPELRNLGKMQKGVHFYSEITAPENCDGDALCDEAKSKMQPGAKLYLKGEIDPGGATLKAGYNGNMEFGSNLVLYNAHLVIEVKTIVNVYFEGEVKIKDAGSGRDVTFRGKLAVSGTGKVELKFSMIGMWEKPFGLGFVSFGNIEAGVAVQPGMPVPFIDFTGELHLGRIGNGNEIKAKVAIGFDPVNSMNTYFYADINQFTLGALLEAFQFDAKLPDAVAQTGFPDGVVIGFTPNLKGKTISHLNANIASGFSLQGTISILGLKLMSKIAINLPKELVVDVEMTPVKIGGGLLALQKSEKETEKGPKLYVKVSKEGVTVKIEAYAFLMGIGSQVVIDVSNKGMVFYVTGNLFNVLEANITASAPYGKLTEAEFKVSSCISTDIGDVKEAATDEIVQSTDETSEAEKLAEGKIKGASSWYESAVKNLKKWTDAIEKKEEAIDRKSNKLEKLCDVLARKCSEKCKKVCVGGPTTNPKCKKILGKWLPCPEWDDCKTKGKDLVCLAKCKAKKVYLKGKGIKKQVTMDILLRSLEVIKRIVAIGQKFVESSKEMIDMMEEASEKLTSSLEAGKQAMKDMAKYTRDNLINIHYLCFDTSLEKASQACFTFKVNVTIGGKKNLNIETDACLDVSFVKEIGLAVAKQLYPGIDSIKSGISKAKRFFRSADKKQDEVQDLKQEALDAENELKDVEAENEAEGSDDDNDDEDDDEEETMTRSHEARNRTLLEKHWRHLAYHSLPAISIRDDQTLDDFKFRSPWAFALHDNPFSTKMASANMNASEADRMAIRHQDIDLKNFAETTKTPCAVSRTVIENYGLISDTVNFLLDSINKEQYMFLLSAKTYERDIKAVEKTIIDRAQENNHTDEQVDDSLFYVGLLKNGTASWMTTVRSQLDQQDKDALLKWRKDLINLLQITDLTAYLETLKAAGKATRRQIIPSMLPVYNDIAQVSQVAEELLLGQESSLTAKKDAIASIGEQVAKLRKLYTAPCMDSV